MHEQPVKEEHLRMSAAECKTHFVRLGRKTVVGLCSQRDNTQQEKKATSQRPLGVLFHHAWFTEWMLLGCESPHSPVTLSHNTVSLTTGSQRTRKTSAANIVAPNWS